jgi:uncharacterized protein (TIGR00369 family)
MRDDRRVGYLAAVPDVPSYPSDHRELALFLERFGADRLPGRLGIELVTLEHGRCTMRMELKRHHEAANGYLHAASVVAIADTAAGYGSIGSLPEGAIGFTTIELKCNHTGTALAGWVAAEATMAHGGRTTQIWDAVVTSEETGRRLGLFRNTQLVLYP